MNSDAIRCLIVDKVHAANSDAKATMNVLSISQDQLGSGTVEIDVQWSSLNFKDALAATGHPGVVKHFPHVPGIDAAGQVVSCSDGSFATGDAVLVTGYDLGQGHWGGWAERIRVPSEWVVRLPSGLTARDAMIYGTAGFTAAQCVLALQRNEVQPDLGEVVVSGATGGVGSIAVRLLAHLGYRVVRRYREIEARAATARFRSDACDQSRRTARRNVSTATECSLGRRGRYCWWKHLDQPSARDPIRRLCRRLRTRCGRGSANEPLSVSAARRDAQRHRLSRLSTSETFGDLGSIGQSVAIERSKSTGYRSHARATC